MKVIRYEDTKVEKLLMKDFFQEVINVFKNLQGLDSIGKIINDFEVVFSQYIGTKYAIAINSGTDALQLSLLVLGIGIGDSVIVPNVTYPAVPLSVIYAGAEPILVDIKDDDLQIDENLIEKNIKKNTKAIIAVHMFARPCNIDKILELAKKYNLYVIEDVCQAESSEYKGQKLGSFGELSCFSFSYYKPLSSCGGGGGMICFNDEKYKKLADYTTVWKDDEVLLQTGRRFPRMYLLDLVAVKTKFKHLEEIKKSRLKIKKIYEDELPKITDIKIFRDNKDSLSIPQNFVIFSKERDKLGRYLEKNSVIWQKPYTPLHLIKIFGKYVNAKFPKSEKYWRETIQLPLFSFMEEDECFRIVDLIKGFYKSEL